MPHTVADRSSHVSDSSTVAAVSEDELQRVATRVATYGGDDPVEPSEKSEGKRVATNLAEEVDPNKVTWDGPDDPENPQNWSGRKKWFVTALCLLMTVNVTFASSAPSPAAIAITEHFHAERELGYLITSINLIGYVFGPLIWGPTSELVGRKPIFQLTLICYTLFHLGQALAPNLATLLVTRGLAGFFAVAPLSNCGGVMFDIWDPVMRGYATALFLAGVFLGPVLGPIIGGFIVSSYLGWRWVFWIMMIFAGTCTIATVVGMPETFEPVLLQKKARRLRKADPEKYKDLYAEHERQDWSWKGVAQRSLLRTFHMLAVEPILMLITVYISLVYGVLYALFEALPVIFVGTRGFTISQSGLVFVGVGIGTTLGAAITPLLVWHYPELLKKWRGFPPPEQRLFGGMIGGPLLVIGAFWLGWTGNYPSIPWIVPALATIPIGASVLLIFISFMSYLVDTYLMYTASAFAANTMVRSMMGAAFPLFTTQMMENMGINWACTLIALLALLLSPSPFLFYKYGPKIRARSKYSPCIDLRIAKMIEAEEAAKASGDEKV